MVFAAFGRDRIRADGLFAVPAFGFVLGFALILVVPSALYLGLVHPDWSWMYLLDPSSMSALLGLAWAPAQVVALMSGWALGGRLARAGQCRWSWVPVVVAVAGIVVVVAVFGDRLGVYGSYEAFAHGAALGLMDVKLGYVLVVLALALAVAGAQVGVALARDSRRVRAR